MKPVKSDDAQEMYKLQKKLKYPRFNFDDNLDCIAFENQTVTCKRSRYSRFYSAFCWILFAWKCKFQIERPNQKHEQLKNLYCF